MVMGALASLGGILCSGMSIRIAPFGVCGWGVVVVGGGGVGQPRTCPWGDAHDVSMVGCHSMDMDAMDELFLLFVSSLSYPVFLERLCASRCSLFFFDSPTPGKKKVRQLSPNHHVCTGGMGYTSCRSGPADLQTHGPNHGRADHGRTGGGGGGGNPPPPIDNTDCVPLLSILS